MRKPLSGHQSGTVNPRINLGCVAIAVLAVGLASLCFTCLVLLSPALLRSAVKDAVCESMAITQGSHEETVQSTVGKSSATQPQSQSPAQRIAILLGVMTVASKVERRNLLRVAYGVQRAADAEVAVRFVVGRPQTEEERLTVGLESLRFQDFLILDCEENMNHGKSFTFFSAVAALGVRYDYVMKVDDDSYVRLDNLAKSLHSQPRSDLYYGYVLPCENLDAYSWYMAGMGYVLSWDLVQWVRDSPVPRNNTDGTEDKLMGDWLNAGGKAKHRVSNKPLFYDHPEFGGKCAHELIPDTILIHQVKNAARWHQVLAFFERHRIAVTPSLASEPS